MSDPATWPTTPPTEPGWWWLAAPNYLGEVEAAVANVWRDIDGELTYSLSQRLGRVRFRDMHPGIRWHPQRIEAP